MERQIIERTEYGYRIRTMTKEQESIRDWAAILVLIAGAIAIISFL